MSFPSSGCLHAQYICTSSVVSTVLITLGFLLRLLLGTFPCNSLETFHEMLPHFSLITVLRCRVNTTANCSCNCEEATLTASCLLLNVWPCQGYTFGRAVQQPRNLLLQQVCGSASVRRVKYVYVSCKAPDITHTDPMIASKVQNFDKWAVRSADKLATTWLEETYRLQPIYRWVGDG